MKTLIKERSQSYLDSCFLIQKQREDEPPIEIPQTNDEKRWEILFKVDQFLSKKQIRSQRHHHEAVDFIE